MSRYNPAEASTAWPEGEYDATIKAVSEQESKTSGNIMDVVVFEVYNGGEKPRDIKEYYPLAGPSLWKYGALASAFGQGDAFRAGTFEAVNHVGQSLRVKLSIEKSDEYGDRNRVARTIRKEGATTTPKPPPPPKVAAADADIPF